MYVGMNYTQIDRTNCMDIILCEFPDFRSQWDEHLEAWPPFLDRPVAIDIDEFANFALELISVGVEAEIDRLAATIEVMLVEGDSVICYAFRMMFLKSIANYSERNGVSIDRFVSRLEPTAAYYFQALDTNWDNKIPVVIPDRESDVEIDSSHH